MIMDYCMMIVTFADEAEAEAVTEKLFSRKLVACAQFQDVKSRYVWKGELVKDTEVLAFFKTKTGLYDEAEALIREMHSYEVPEIICLPVEKGLAEYLAWIDENTDRG